MPGPPPPPLIIRKLVPKRPLRAVETEVSSRSFAQEEEKKPESAPARQPTPPQSSPGGTATARAAVWREVLFHLFRYPEGITLEFRKDRLMAYPNDSAHFANSNARTMVVMHRSFFSEFEVVGGESFVGRLDVDRTLRLRKGTRYLPRKLLPDISLTIGPGTCRMTYPEQNDVEFDVASTDRPSFPEPKGKPSAIALFSGVNEIESLADHLESLVRERRGRRVRFLETEEARLAVTSSDSEIAPVVVGRRDGTTALRKKFDTPFMNILMMSQWSLTFAFEHMNVRFLVDADCALFEFSKPEERRKGLSAKLLIRGAYV